MKRVLVVCTGNICRSPMAACWLESSWGGAVHVESAGTQALVGRPAEPNAVEVLKEQGFDLSGHRARQVTPEMVRGSDLVLVMEGRHRALLMNLAPSATGKIWRFGHLEQRDVPDPYGLDRREFAAAFQTIQRMGSSWLAFGKDGR